MTNLLGKESEDSLSRTITDKVLVAISVLGHRSFQEL